MLPPSADTYPTANLLQGCTPGGREPCARGISDGRSEEEVLAFRREMLCRNRCKRHMSRHGRRERLRQRQGRCVSARALARCVLARSRMVMVCCSGVARHMGGRALMRSGGCTVGHLAVARVHVLRTRPLSYGLRRHHHGSVRRWGVGEDRRHHVRHQRDGDNETTTGQARHAQRVAGVTCASKSWEGLRRLRTVHHMPSRSLALDSTICPSRGQGCTKGMPA